MNNQFADIHCHSTMQAYSNAFPTKEQLQTKMNLIQSGVITDKSSLWYYNPPTLEERLLRDVLGITRYSQSDYTTLTKGCVRLIFSSLYTIEKGFFIDKLGTGELSNEMKEFFCGINENRIEYVINFTDYFSDLCAEYDFLKQKSGMAVNVNNTNCNYILARNAQEINAAINDTQKYSIAIVNTIEGMHSFGSGLNPTAPFSTTNYLNNLTVAKQWDSPPLFATFTHHFYNQLCGHCESLQKISLFVDQSYGMSSDFTPFGFDVIDAMLSKSNGKRILVDIKHMSKIARHRFYNLLATNYNSESIPIIAIHAAVSGNGNPLFCNEEINFDDDEIMQIKRSCGLFGIMFEKNRIASPEALPSATGNIFEGKKLWSKLIWNQIQYIAQLIDNNGFDGAWDIQCLGSDYDGIINPINHFITDEDMPDLSVQLIKHAENFMDSDGKKMRSGNKLVPNDIIDKVMFRNAYNFVMSNY